MTSNIANETKKVSIIIPVYNNEKFLKKCLDSIIGQKYNQLEIIVVNDGSKDSSRSIIEEYAQKDKRMILINQENKGVSCARNEGLKRATGEFLTFVDGDDYIGSDYIEKLVQTAEENQADLVISGLKKVDERGNVLEDIIPGEYVRFEREEWTFRISAVAAHLYKRELWDKYEVRFVEGERGEDMPLSLFFSAVCNITTLPISEYYYVQHNASAMHNFKGLRQLKLPYKSLELMIQKAKDIGITNSVDNFELFVVRILATCVQLAKGAEQEDIDVLAGYITHIFDSYFPEIHKNPLVKLNSSAEVPFFQKAAVWSIVTAWRYNGMKLFLRFVCK